ncbi:MAG: hypothetical protein ABI655_07190 [Phenylobacterium sp.]
MESGSQLTPEPEVIEHERAYKGFNVLLRWCMVLLGDAILTLTLWFASPVGFWGAVIAGLVVFVAGYIFVIRHEEHQPLDLWTAGR